MMIKRMGKHKEYLGAFPVELQKFIKVMTVKCFNSPSHYPHYMELIAISSHTASKWTLHYRCPVDYCVRQTLIDYEVKDDDD